MVPYTISGCAVANMTSNGTAHGLLRKNLLKSMLKLIQQKKFFNIHRLYSSIHGADGQSLHRGNGIF